ncbi:MAG: ATP-binding protein [Thiotrichales bacterium]
MRWSQPSLLLRTVLLIVLVLVVSQTAWLLLGRWAEQEPRARQIAHRAASVVGLTRAALIAARPESRHALLDDLSRREGIRIYPLAYEDLIPPLPDDPLVRLIETEVKRVLGDSTQVIVTEADVEGLWVSFSIDADEYWVIMPRTPLERPFPWRLAGWGSFVLAASVLGAWLMVAAINRPLSAITRAATALGHGERPAKVAETGAPEIQALGRAFNRMAYDLGQQDADRALLLAGISHDLRTPLSRLRLGVELNVRDPAEQEAMVADVDEMERVIAQFLEFAQRDDQSPLEDTDPGELLVEIAGQFDRRGVRLETEIASLPRMPLARESLRRALVNLVENALRYGGPHVALVGERGAKGVTLGVLDRGPGIPEDQLVLVKRPFKRLDAARSGGVGTGLGLAIVERAARRHGGDLTLRNRNGGGLAALIELPLQHETIT